jgi:hypothetical protein
MATAVATTITSSLAKSLSPRRDVGIPPAGCARAAARPLPALFACLFRAFFFLLNDQLLKYELRMPPSAVTVESAIRLPIRRHSMREPRLFPRELSLFVCDQSPIALIHLRFVIFRQISQRWAELWQQP